MDERDDVVTREVTEYGEFHLELPILTMLMMLAILTLTAAVSSTSSAVAQGVLAQAYAGRPYSKTHTATEVLSWIDFIHEWPYTPLMSVFLINDGPDPVEVAVNYPNDRCTMEPYETRTITRPGAQERIAIIFFKCAEGETASVRVEGEY